MTTETYTVQRSRNGKRWDIISPSGSLVEGGFFTRQAAETARALWELEDEQNRKKEGGK